MRQNSLALIEETLQNFTGHEIEVDAQIREKALVSIKRLLDFSAALKEHGSVEAMFKAGVRI